MADPMSNLIGRVISGASYIIHPDRGGGVVLQFSDNTHLKISFWVTDPYDDDELPVQVIIDDEIIDPIEEG